MRSYRLWFNVLLSIGHDGGGPWVFARALACALARVLISRGVQPRFCIDYGQTKPDADRERVGGLTDQIQRCGGQVLQEHVYGTKPLLWLPRNGDTNLLDLDEIEPQVLVPFLTALEEYAQAFEKRVSSIDGGIGLVIGVVEPCAVHAASRIGIPAIQVGDLLWDVTFRMILRDAGRSMSPAAEQALSLISGIAARASHCFLWPRPVTPDVYYDAAVKSGATVTRLGGVVGKQSSGETWNEGHVRRYYGISDELPIVCITGGALGSLKALFENVKAEYGRRPPRDYHVIIDEKLSTVFRSGREHSLVRPRLQLSHIARAVEVFLMRCGASTDTVIAARCPCVSLPEPDHFHVNEIARAAEQMGLAPMLTPRQAAELAAHPRDWIERELFDPARAADRQRVRAALEQIQTDAGFSWARTVVERLTPTLVGTRILKTILIAANEDGYGTSSMLFHLIRALVSLLPDYAIILRTGTKVAFNERLYADILSPTPAPGRVWIEPVHNLIQLVNRGDGRIDAEASLEALSRYPVLRDQYLRQSLHGATFAIECGVPTLAKACSEAGIPCYTVFDHSWALTFRRIMLAHVSKLQSLYSGIQPSKQLEKAFAILEADEASTRKVFLFDPALTSREYWNHWKRLCPGRVASIGGLLGGPKEGEERTFRNEARRILNLNPDDDRPVLLVSAGGTGIWAELLPSLVEKYVRLDSEHKLDMHVFVFAGLDVENAIATRVEIGPEERYEFSDGRSVAFRPILAHGDQRIEQPRVRLLRGALNCTYQQIIAGVDFVLTRAGVVTLMDAWATGVCSLLVPQPGHAQVEEVHQAAVDAGLALGLPFDQFWKDPVETINRAMTGDNVWSDVKKKMTAFARNRQSFIVQQILDDIGSSL